MKGMRLGCCGSRRNRVNEHNEVRVAFTGTFGEGLDAQFLGKDRVSSDAWQLEKLELQSVKNEVFRVAIHGLGQILRRFVKLGIGDGLLEVETIAAPHVAAHMIHRLHDDLPAIAENQLIKFQFWHGRYLS